MAVDEVISSELLKILVCPICKFNVGAKGRNLVCSKCGAEYSVEDGIPKMLPPSSVGEFDLRITAEKWSEEYQEKGNDLKIDLKKTPELRYSYNHVRKYLKPRSGLFLEAGCGLAKNSCLLAKDGVKVVGLDISMSAVKKAKLLFENEGEEGWFVCGNMLQMPFQDETFSSIYAGGAIEHFKDTLTAVKELRRCLKKKGTLSTTVPIISLSAPYILFRGNIPDVPLLNSFLEFFHLKLLKGKFLEFGYEKSFSISQISNLFKRAGFTDVYTGFFETHYPLPAIRNDFLKKMITRIAKMRLFWPMIYVNAVKS